jgi:hypothetical protein
MLGLRMARHGGWVFAEAWSNASDSAEMGMPDPKNFSVAGEGDCGPQFFSSFGAQARVPVPQN